MRKHAYLIVAHHEFDVLTCLVAALDDERNTIFIHFDKKVPAIPNLVCRYAELIVLDNRIDVRWGDVSQIKVELLLFNTAFKHDEYAYYHLMSGVDMPLKSQDYTHAFFEHNLGTEFIGFTSGDISKELERKAKRYHLFSKHFVRKKGFIQFVRRAVRAAFMQLQITLNLYRSKSIELKKGTNWVSVTHNFVGHLLTQEHHVLKTYQHTFCADEIYKQTICWHSPFHKQIYDIQDEGRGSLRLIGWENGQINDFTNKDYEKLIHSPLLFARKFNSKNMDIVHKILKKVSN
ncbi:beta-1,6-N-acetylglucosaminyltransferase [Sphingobacterium corticibacter]|uniref:Peptide O-xylosyltransferase n=1 Tax=Sphingobacterium corticibacter TaxID=2171749 RepID=A0A2T8HKQ7_9SPHI|nr:beta-1,6-N-acetylglucosaminyltransferase [Sphingobacterium corticibacter]PVH26029.1 glycosyl transferase [Sphingobacterium corticibacter]